MGGYDLTEAHSSVRLAALHDASMMIGLRSSLWCQPNCNARRENRKAALHGATLYLRRSEITLGFTARDGCPAVCMASV